MITFIFLILLERNKLRYNFRMQSQGVRFDHTGAALEDDREFSEQAPSEIGKVLSAFSTMRRGDSPKFVKTSITMAQILCLPLILGSVLLWAFGQRLGDDALFAFFGLMIFGGSAAIYGLIQRRPHECSYVGERGLARFSSRPPRSDRARQFTHGGHAFERFRVLYVQKTIGDHSGAYTGTVVNFLWRDGDGKLVFRSDANYFSLKDTPNRDNALHFGRAAEKAWTDWVLVKHRTEYETSGKTGFPLEFGGGIFVSRHGITVRQGKTETELSRDEVKSISVDNGRISFHREIDSRGLLGKTPFSVPYATVGNAQAFLRLASEVLNIRVG
jgi:hypothetical protein